MKFANAGGHLATQAGFASANDYAMGRFGMLNVKRTFTVARFELLEALKSRLVVVLVLLYGGGAAMGSAIFLRLLRSAEEATRDALAQQGGLDPASLPDDLVREQAMPWLVSLVEDEATQQQLLDMDPLSIFFGFSALQSVALLVLLMAAASVASDVASGAARFVLFRCDRLSWVIGKTLGQAVLLAGCLLIAALASASVGALIDMQLDGSRLVWLVRTAFRAWVYGLAYLGIFTAVSMLSSTPMRARAGAVFIWLFFGVAHALLSASFWGEVAPIANGAAWLFPGHHDLGLWSGHWGVYLGSVVMLLGIGAAAFAMGYRVFEGRDA